ncbi:MAG: hypothetical protein WD646_06375 [Actinomycetota bacterium]
MISTVADRRSGLSASAARSAFPIIAMAIVGLLVLGVSCSGDNVVERLTIVNRTPFDVEVEVTDAKKESWLILGRAAPESSTVSELVTDMGPTWVFRFHHGGRTVSQLTVNRGELSRARWRVEVPPAVTDRMRKLGIKPPPDSSRRGR